MRLAAVLAGFVVAACAASPAPAPAETDPRFEWTNVYFDGGNCAGPNGIRIFAPTVEDLADSAAVADVARVAAAAHVAECAPRGAAADTLRRFGAPVAGYAEADALDVAGDRPRRLYAWVEYDEDLNPTDVEIVRIDREPPYDFSGDILQRTWFLRATDRYAAYAAATRSESDRWVIGRWAARVDLCDSDFLSLSVERGAPVFTLYATLPGTGTMAMAQGDWALDGETVRLHATLRIDPQSAKMPTPVWIDADAQSEMRAGRDGGAFVLAARDDGPNWTRCTTELD